MLPKFYSDYFLLAFSVKMQNFHTKIERSYLYFLISSIYNILSIWGKKMFSNNEATGILMDLFFIPSQLTYGSKAGPFSMYLDL